MQRSEKLVKTVFVKFSE